MWQLAKILNVRTERFRHLIGTTVWVQAERPRPHRDAYDGGTERTGFTTHLVDNDGIAVALEPHNVELLGEFRTDVQPEVVSAK